MIEALRAFYEQFGGLPPELQEWDARVEQIEIVGGDPEDEPPAAEVIGGIVPRGPGEHSYREPGFESNHRSDDE